MTHPTNDVSPTHFTRTETIHYEQWFPGNPERDARLGVLDRDGLPGHYVMLYPPPTPDEPDLAFEFAILLGYWRIKSETSGDVRWVADEDFPMTGQGGVVIARS